MEANKYGLEAQGVKNVKKKKEKTDLASPPSSSCASVFSPLVLPLGLLLAGFLEHKVEPAPPLHVEREEVVVEDRPFMRGELADGCWWVDIPGA